MLTVIVIGFLFLSMASSMAHLMTHLAHGCDCLEDGDFRTLFDSKHEGLDTWMKTHLDVDWVKWSIHGKSNWVGLTYIGEQGIREGWWQRV